MRLEDMRLFARVAELKSFTAAAAALGMPKQTVSRRISELEASLGVKLLRRTTRRLQLSEPGVAYAQRCAEIVRLADDANREVTDTQETPRGVLRITADPVFGEAFLTGLVIDYARRWPEVRLEVVLTRRRVDLIEEDFDLAFRVGAIEDSPALAATRLGPARIRYCASPAYLHRRGTPRAPSALATHDCLVVASDGTQARWPFRGDKGPAMIPVSGRLQMNSFAMAHAAALEGLGIALFPEFACAADLERKRLVSVLDEHVMEVGAVWLVHATRRHLPARVRELAALARARFQDPAPWVVPKPTRRRRQRS